MKFSTVFINALSSERGYLAKAEKLAAENFTASKRSCTKKLNVREQICWSVMKQYSRKHNSSTPNKKITENKTLFILKPAQT